MAWTKLTFEDLEHTVLAGQRWVGELHGDAGTIQLQAPTWAAMAKLVHAEMMPFKPGPAQVVVEQPWVGQAEAVKAAALVVAHHARTPVANSEQPVVPSPAAQVAAAFRGAALTRTIAAKAAHTKATRPVGRPPGKK